MMLRLLDQFHDVELTDGEAERSRHTGRLLREVEVGFNCGDAMTDQLNAELNAARTKGSALQGEGDTRWVVRSHNYSGNGNGAWRYTVGLRQVEDLRAERLEFLGLSLTPIYFEEPEDRDGPIVIIAEVAPNAEDSETLERHIMEQRTRNEGQVREYFDLRRVGVNDEPIRVRFGRCLWKAGEGGARQHLVVFVSADGDSDEIYKGLGFDEPRATNAARVALQGREIVEAILEELGLAGVLPQDAVERIRRRGDSAWSTRSRDLNQTDDLSQFR